MNHVRARDHCICILYHTFFFAWDHSLFSSINSLFCCWLCISGWRPDVCLPWYLPGKAQHTSRGFRGRDAGEVHGGREAEAETWPEERRGHRVVRTLRRLTYCVCVCGGGAGCFTGWNAPKKQLLGCHFYFCIQSSPACACLHLFFCLCACVFLSDFSNQSRNRLLGGGEWPGPPYFIKLSHRTAPPSPQLTSSKTLFLPPPSAGPHLFSPKPRLLENLISSE